MAFLLVPLMLQGKTLKEAMDEAAEYFVKQAVRIEPGQELHVLEVVNYHNQKHDMVGKKIETEMYFALERQFPDFKLFLGRGQNKEKEIYLAGTYEEKGEKVNVKFRVFKGKEILAQTQVNYEKQKVHRKTLVAVLDIESDGFSEIELKAYSDIFRSSLIKLDTFEIASSADVDKMNPDQIQQATGCTRDTCATIIGEQLGVDRVISSSIFKLDDSTHVISAKMMDIQDGSILASETVNHKGSLSSLDRSLNILAHRLAGEEDQLETYAEKKESSNLIWHISAITLGVLSIGQAQATIGKYNDLEKTNEELIEEYKYAFNQNDLNRIQEEIDANQEQMAQYKSDLTMFNAIAAVAVTWELYLLFFSGPDEEEESGEENALNHNYRKQNGFSLAVVPYNDAGIQSTRIGFRYTW